MCTYVCVLPIHKDGYMCVCMCVYLYIHMYVTGIILVQYIRRYAWTIHGCTYACNCGPVCIVACVNT